MEIERLSYTGFRNLRDDVFLPVSGVNILYGDNAQGKTNLLEGIWLFTGGRSFRGAKDSELPAFGQETARLCLTFQAEERVQEAEITVAARRAATLNGVPQASASKLAGHFCAVVFSPAHLSLIKGGPEERRRFLDAAYCQVRPGYLAVLSEYGRTLKQRNALLKAPDEELLDVWDRKLAATGARITMARTAYVRKLSPLAAAVYAGLSGGKEEMTVSLQTMENEGQAALTQGYYTRLKETYAADSAAGFTTTGPHREDMQVQINGISARAFGSQGQQRSAVLALKLAEASVLQEVTGEPPVALLDDVMSELDLSRQRYILEHMHARQVFITCCDPSTVERAVSGKAFCIREGRLQTE